MTLITQYQTLKFSSLPRSNGSTIDRPGSASSIAAEIRSQPKWKSRKKITARNTMFPNEP